ncbi:MAG: NAD(P)H-dependent oxidoreductase [Phycisphaeraceae bacterium]|nr:NAD(P)H-dependent oxidoreductase [Phycisphaerales bacterium]MCB9860950.1 NAD(P)H-dependent oxidoreductase [Phycisphaeraceae bacterium]
MKHEPLKIVAFAGSVRDGARSSAGLRIAVDQFGHMDGVDVVVVDLRDISLPMPGRSDDDTTQTFRDLVESADGVFLATPEYHGSFSSVTKLAIDNLGFPSVLRGKPVALLGVAAGRIGAIKALEHLRSVCSHLGALVLPGPISVANAGAIFDDNGNCTDASIEKAIRGLADQLVEYVRTFTVGKCSLEESARA